MAWFHVIKCLSIALYFNLTYLQPIEHIKEAGACYGDSFTTRRKITALVNTLETAELRLREAFFQYEELSVKFTDLMKLVGFLIRGTGIDIEDICERLPTVVTSHPKECRLYYNCSDYHTVYWWNPMAGNLTYLHECTYPELFSEETLRCENYTQVDCGSRRESKFACDYYFHKCKLSHCIPCKYRFPRCDDKGDGLWPPDDRFPTTSYVICKNGRPQLSGHCQKDLVWNVAAFPYNKKCTSIFEIPESDGGFLPSCVEKKNGKYRFDTRPCDTYVQCESGNSTIHKCPPPTLFDAQSQTCNSTFVCRN